MRFATVTFSIVVALVLAGAMGVSATSVNKAAKVDSGLVLYQGPGSVGVMPSGGEIVFLFGDIDSEDGELEGAKYTLRGGLEGQRDFWVDGWLVVSQTRQGEIFVMVDGFAIGAFDPEAEVNFLSFGATVHQTEQTQPAAASEEESCPGGRCSCNGPHGAASACCPAGRSPVCRCTASASTGVCVKDRLNQVIHLDLGQLEIQGSYILRPTMEVRQALQFGLNAAVEPVYEAGLVAEKEVLFPVRLPYYGPGLVMTDDGDIVFVFGDPRETDHARYEAVAFSYSGKDLFKAGELFVEVDDEGQLHVAIDELYLVLDVALTELGVTSARQALAAGWDSLQEAAAEEACPGGKCSCQGPHGPAEACCPAGKTPRCICNNSVSSARCEVVRTQYAELSLWFSSAEPAPAELRPSVK